MIKIINKHDCCGCEACVQACPKQCISFEQDNEGFSYPQVDINTCIECGICLKVCPISNDKKQNLGKKIWAAQDNDERKRKESSSGGIANMLAEKIIDEGGIVFGVCMSNVCEAVHSYAETKEQLASFSGSKYLQSKIGKSFKRIKCLLKTDRKVLFFGTPCQVSGLKRFLGREYSNLITVDFICHGVPSPGVFKWYLQEKINKFTQSKKSETTINSNKTAIFKDSLKIPEGLRITDICFRDKREGWKNFGFSISFVETNVDGLQNVVSFFESKKDNPFLKGFIADLYLRPSCHQCRFRNFYNESDITLADFWGQDVLFPEFDNDTGVSCVIIKSNIGEQLFSSIENVKKEEKSIEQVIRFNKSLVISKHENFRRYKFWRQIGKYSFQESVDRAINLTLVERVASKFISFFS